MAWSLGTVIQIGLRLITHRGEVEAAWNKANKLINDVMVVVPEIQGLMNKIAPELMPARTSALRTIPSQVPQVHDFDVTWVQRTLNRLLRANLEVDGHIGPQTTSAIEKFQQMHGLTVDGWLGMITLAKLEEEYEKHK